MRSKLLLAATGISAGAALLLAPVAIASAPSYQVTGGGQIIDSGATGAGSTITISARTDGTTASGQVQYVERSGGTGQTQTVQHGTVLCVQTTGTNTARIAGTWTDGSPFQLDVTDNGTPAQGTDTILISKPSNPDCQNSSNGQPGNLGRGNITIHQTSS